MFKLKGEDILLLGRHEHVAAGLKDWRSFSSTSRPWHDPNSVRPELLLTDDPPKHTRVRAVIGNALSPKALASMAAAFRVDADAIVEAAAQKAARGEKLDAVADFTQPFVYKVLPDLLGIMQKGREHMYDFGNMVWATMGPMNALFQEAMQATGQPVIDWATDACKRENLSAGSLGMAMYEAADRGEITADEAYLLVGILLSAAADTTVLTLATAIRAFCEFPDQYALLRSDPSLVRAAFDESLRWDSPSRMAGRIAMKDVRDRRLRRAGRHALRADVRRGEPRPAPLAGAGPFRHPARQRRQSRLRLRRARLRGPRARAARGRCAAGRGGATDQPVRVRRRRAAVDDDDRPRTGRRADPRHASNAGRIARSCEQKAPAVASRRPRSLATDQIRTCVRPTPRTSAAGPARR